MRHGDAHSAKQLNSLGDRVNELRLLLVMFVEEQVQLVERGTRNLPVMLLVQISERRRVGQQLIQIVDGLTYYRWKA